MALEFERSCQQSGGSKVIIVPPEILTALGIEVGDTTIIRYYEKTKNGKTYKYASFWKKGE